MYFLWRRFYFHVWLEVWFTIIMLYWPPALFVSFHYLLTSSVRAAFPSAWRMSLYLRLYQLVSENVCFILKHLMLKEAVQQDWSQEPRGHQALGAHCPFREVAWCSWPSVFGVSWFAVVPVKTPLLWKLSFLQAAPRSVSFVFVSVVFTLLGPMRESVFPLLFGVHMALGLTRRWRSGCTLCSLWAPVLCDCLVAATPLLLTDFFPVLLSLQTLNVSIPVISVGV